MQDRKALYLLLIIVFVILAVSIPMQYLVQKEVVVGLTSEAEHSHAHSHDEEEGAHSEEGEGQAQEHEHTEEEGHLATEVPLGVNLIPNYSFESGTREQIWGWLMKRKDADEAVYRDTDVSRSGTASAAIDTNGDEVGGSGWLTLLDELPLEHVVFFEGYIRTQDMEGSAYLLITLETRQEGQSEAQLLGYSFSKAVDGNSDWTLCSASIYVPAETSGVWLEVAVQGRGRAWFDDVSLTVEEPEEE